MKRYYTSVVRYRIVMIFLPMILIFNAVLLTFNKPDTTGFMGSVNQYTNFMFALLAIFVTIHLVRILNKDVYFGISPDKMINKLSKRELIYEYSDAESYTVKRSGKGINLYYKSIKSGKKVRIGLYIFEIDRSEFMNLLKTYSNKEVYFKDYGEEPRLIVGTEEII